MKKCRNPWCNKEFAPNHSRQKYCSDECAKFIRRHQKHGKIPEKIIYVICENPECGKEHDGTYGSGRFCSEHCAYQFAYYGKRKKGQKTTKQISHLKRIHDMRRKSVEWNCKVCGQKFKTRSELNKHLHKDHGVKKAIQDKSGRFECPYCHSVWSTQQKLGGHISNCKMHPNKVQHDLAHKQGGKTLTIGYKSGRLVNKHKGKHHTAITKQHMREAACRYLQKINATPCRYNKSSIKILEQIAKEHGWNIQHAENGGEFYTGIGYFVDAYDKDKNVVLEYDEPVHYEDVENNILREKDLKRQKEIIEHLHCEYWRYNEKMKLLWKVE